MERVNILRFIYLPLNLLLQESEIISTHLPKGTVVIDDEAFQHLGLPLFDLLMSNEKYYHFYGAIVEVVAQYTFEAQSVPNKLVPLLALGNKLKGIFQVLLK